MSVNNKRSTTIVLIFISLIVLFISSICCHNYNTTKQVTTVDSVNIIDSISIDTIGNKYSANADYFEIAREYSLAKDSIELLKDSLNISYNRLNKVLRNRDSIHNVNIKIKEKLAVAEYKLLRIREYNRIAAQGNNIVFLRGWIKRVINK